MKPFQETQLYKNPSWVSKEKAYEKGDHEKRLYISSFKETKSLRPG